MTINPVADRTRCGSAIGRTMTKEEITEAVLNIFGKEFEIDHPDLDLDLREAYEFDSVDAIELLIGIERFLKSELTHDEKKQAMEIRTIRQVIDYVAGLAEKRAANGNPVDA
jgi:acyl carrier protein